MRKYFVFGWIVLSLASCLQNGKLENGVAAPDISLPDTSGHMVSLRSLRGNIVLVDFWASWCVPCRRENPYLVQVYNEFKDKQFQGAQKFTIMSISLDSEKDAWLKAIKRDSLYWPLQLCQLDGWKSSAVTTYHIDAIPVNYLVDENGIIIGKDMRSDDLFKLLNERVKK